MNISRPFSVIAFGLGALAVGPGSLSALDIFGGVTTGNQRFSDTFPTLPTINGSFAFSSLDFSGVGWQTTNSQLGVTMISPQDFATAAHVAPADGSSVTFLSSAGILRSYTVNSTFNIEHTAGVNTDIVIGRLSAPIPASDQVAFYPTLVLNSFNAYNNLPLVVYGQTGVVGTNNVDGFLLNFDLLPFGNGNGTADSILLETQFDSVTGESQARSGDSGSPTFIVASGQLVIVGVHSAINGSPPPDLTLDSFLPGYYSGINARLNLDGFTFGALTAVPEPGTTVLLAGLAALAAGFWRRFSI